MLTWIVRCNALFFSPQMPSPFFSVPLTLLEFAWSDDREIVCASAQFSEMLLKKSLFVCMFVWYRDALEKLAEALEEMNRLNPSPGL